VAKGTATPAIGRQVDRLTRHPRHGYSRERETFVHVLRFGQSRPAEESSVAFYSETTPDGVGLTPNPEGFAFTDNGLGTFLRSGFGSAPNPNATWRQFAAASDGKMQTSNGNLHLTDQEENQIVKFLETLSDGFTRPYPDIDTFTGACMTGGDASTQGNALIIPAALMRR